MIRKYNNQTLQTNKRYREEGQRTLTVTRHQEDKESKSTSSLSSSTLEGHRVLNNKTRTKIEPPQTMGATINNDSTTTEPTP